MSLGGIPPSTLGGYLLGFGVVQREARFAPAEGGGTFFPLGLFEHFHAIQQSVGDSDGALKR